MQNREILITGGAGFVGTNVARSYLAEGQSVHIFDNLSRPGVEQNVAELQERYPRQVRVSRADTRDRAEVQSAVRGASVIYHFAAQVAVTSSLQDPIDDLETNLLGTVNILEAIRKTSHRPSLLFTSTNKVYGKLSGVALAENGSRYEPIDSATARRGAGEDQPLEFLSPYGCSKGGADQYVLDYARSYGIPAAVFRMSCIYGPYQLGSEDQGWVAHFLRQAMKGEPITIYGDGKQVRDLLYVEDLVAAMRLTQANMAQAAGEAFNIGGGPANSTSLIELIEEIGALIGERVDVQWGAERIGDQKWYVADSSKLSGLLAWRQATSIRAGLRRLHEWYLTRPALVASSREVQVA